MASQTSLKDGRSPLHDAARIGSEDTIRKLLEKGIDVKVVDKDGRTPLHDAARTGSKDTVRWLLEKGADVRAIDKDGRTPLHDAARGGSDDTVRSLLEKGADMRAIDKDGRTPLHDAARAGSDDTVRRLVEKGADIEATDNNGLLPRVPSPQSDPVMLNNVQGLDLESQKAERYSSESISRSAQQSRAIFKRILRVLHLVKQEDPIRAGMIRLRWESVSKTIKTILRMSITVLDFWSIFLL